MAHDSSPENDVPPTAMPAAHAMAADSNDTVAGAEMPIVSSAEEMATTPFVDASHESRDTGGAESVETGPPAAAVEETALVSDADATARCLEADEQELAAERVEAERWRAHRETWLERRRRFHAGIAALRDEFVALFERCNARFDALPETISEQLRGRRESLELCGRMLERLATRTAAEAAETSTVDPVLLASLRADDVRNLVDAAPPEQQARSIRALLRERRIRNREAIVALRRLAEDAEARLVGTITRHFFPIVEGLDEGKRIAVVEGAALGEHFPDHRADLTKWLGLYDELIDASLQTLHRLDIDSIAVGRGDRADYEQVEPLETEPDPELLDEQVKTVLRRGYTLFAGSATARVLRPAQVVIVRN